MGNDQDTIRIEVDERTPLLPDTASDNHIAESETQERPSNSVIWLVFPMLLAGIFLSNVVSSVVIATNQRIASEFDALSSAAWLLTTYTLAQSASQPLYGKLSDIYGRKECLVFCWTIFGFGCFVVSIGSKYWHILLGRALSGIGSAGKIALASIIVADVIPLPQIAQYRAYVNLTATTARSLGGPIGGWLAGSVGWRWPFRVQLPMALIGLGLVLWKLPEPRREIANQGDDSSEQVVTSSVSPITRVDFAGATALVSMVLTGLLALDQATKGASYFTTGCLTTAFTVSITAFYLVESYWAREPILPLSIVFKRDVITSYSIICFQAAGQFGLLYAIPIYFQVVRRESVSTSGARIVPVVIGNAVGTYVSQRIITKTHRYKALTAFGNVMGIVGFSLILARWQGDVQWFDTLYVALPGTGMGILQSTTFIHLAASLGHSEIAIAGASWFLAQNIGVLVGASFSTSIINYVLEFKLRQALEGLEDKDEIIKHALSNVEYIQNLPEKLWSLVSGAYVSAIAASNVLSIAFILLSLAVTISMKEKTLGKKK